MKNASIVIGAAMVAATALSPVRAEVDAKWAQAEAKEHGCLNCHAIDTKKVGPSYKSVSAKYKGKSTADVAAPMKALPVHKGVMSKTSEQDLKLMLEWILTL